MLVANFSSGTVTAIMRFVVFLTVPLATDVSFYGARVAMRTTIEPGVYLIAACLPSLRTLFKEMIGFITSIETSSQGTAVEVALSPVKSSKQGSHLGFHKLEDIRGLGDHGDKNDGNSLVTYPRSSRPQDKDTAGHSFLDLESQQELR